jgi:hypothetical protein
MKNATLCLLAAAALAATPALATEEPAVVFPHHDLLAGLDAARDSAYWKSWAQDFTHELRHELGAMFAPRMGPGKVVKGAPYSAEVVTEANQTLADGNVITRRKTGAVYRDGEGRTRQETGPEGKERTVFIDDPVADTHVVLTPSSRRAISVAPRVTSFKYDTKDKEVVRLGASEVRVEDGKVFIDGKQVAGPGRVEVSRNGRQIVIEDGRITIDGKPLAEVVGNRHVSVKRVDSGDGTRREEVRVQVIRGEDGREMIFAPAPPVPPVAPVPGVAPVAPAPPVPPLPGITTMRFESTARLGKGTTTSLGMKDFDGVKAEGKSTTWTIAAGEIGNRNPITVMSETWYSPDLQVTVYSRHSDPRTGESIYRLGSIRRGEPAPDLFKVPEDYTVKRRAPKG